MKRMLFLFTTLIYTLLFVGCKSNNQNPIIYKDTNANETNLEEHIQYQVEQVSLSKGYQNIEPNVEVIKKGLDFKLLVSLGLMESSNINITEINKVDDEINIHVKNQKKIGQSQIVVPQVLINLQDLRFKDKDNLKFNIINENYDPIKIKLGANEVINKINADFKISMNNLPLVNIISENNRILWELTYNNIFDKYNLETPIINLSVLIDANNGDIVKSSKDLISSLIDEGYILDYTPNKFILYKKVEENIEDDNLEESLWEYNIENNNTQMLYTSKSKIIAAAHNPNTNHIAIIESQEEDHELYMVESDSKKAYKVFSKQDIDPALVRWKSNDELYILDKDEKNSRIYKYNIIDNTSTLVASTSKDIVDLQIMGDSFLITEGNENREDLKIYLTKDWTQYELEENGFRPMYINDNKIAYLKFNKNDSTNSFRIYDIENRKAIDNIQLNIGQYFLLDDENLALIERNKDNNEFTFHKYNIKNKTIKTIANINSEKVFYNRAKSLLYVELPIPFESEKSQIIYSVDLSKMSN